MVKLSDYLVRFIANLGVKHVFMFPGGGAMHLNDSVGSCSDIEFIINHHEQACTIAAEAYARIDNNLGVAMVTTGPGGTNAITGVAAAWLDSTPCLFISGQVKRSDLISNKGLRQLGVQEIDIVSIIKPITKYAVTILEPETIRFHLEKAAYLAKSGRPGPVWIDIPLDVQAAMIELERLSGFIPNINEQISDRSELKNQVAEVIDLLNQSCRPVILAGNGIRLGNAIPEFMQLVDSLGIPVLTTRLGVDLISGNHESSFGMPGSIAPRSANFILQNSDFLLILGARMDMALMAYAPERLARAAKKVMVNIDLLEIQKLGSIIDIPICADIKDFLKEFSSQGKDIKPVNRSSWIQYSKSLKKKYPFVTSEHRIASEFLSIYAFTEVLSEELSEDCVVLPGNSGNACELFLTAFNVKPGQRVFHNKGTGAMGFSQPAAIGACLASGRRQTIAIDGDGGFQLNIQELETIRRLNLPIKFFVMNNQGYASIRASQQTYFGRLVGADATSGLSLPDVVAVANAYGLRALRITEFETLREQIRMVLDIDGPVVCDVMILKDEPRAPRVSSERLPDGKMVSKPLEDMWPFLDRDEFNSNMLIPPIGNYSNG